MHRKRIAAGNWKMNGKAADLDHIAEIAAAASEIDNAVTLLALPAALIDRAAAHRSISIDAQNCQVATSGAYTGELSAAMLADARAA